MTQINNDDNAYFTIGIGLQKQRKDKVNKYIIKCVSDIREAQSYITDTTYSNGVSQEWKDTIITKYMDKIENVTNKLIRLYANIGD